MLHIKELKEAKPVAYDMTPEEWQEIHRAAEAEGPRKYTTYIHLQQPFKTALQLQQLTGIEEVPPVMLVKTSTLKPGTDPSRIIEVCEVEFGVWKDLANRLVCEGYEKCWKRVWIGDKKRDAHWCEKPMMGSSKLKIAYSENKSQMR